MNDFCQWKPSERVDRIVDVLSTSSFQNLITSRHNYNESQIAYLSVHSAYHNKKTSPNIETWYTCKLTNPHHLETNTCWEILFICCHDSQTAIFQQTLHKILITNSPLYVNGFTRAKCRVKRLPLFCGNEKGQWIQEEENGHWTLIMRKKRTKRIQFVALALFMLTMTIKHTVQLKQITIRFIMTRLMPHYSTTKC